MTDNIPSNGPTKDPLKDPLNQSDMADSNEIEPKSQQGSKSTAPDNGGFDTPQEYKEMNDKISDLRGKLNARIIGQEVMIDLIIAAVLADGHVLLEGVPGVAKTMTAKLFAKTIAVEYGRIQFTPDLMPSDILGTSVFDPAENSFEFKRGPVFTNILLIDEINRSPAKTQSALFEVMEERQVTIDGQTYSFEPPFTVIATQNPIEQEGTYRLPEAQLDRFLFKINVDYPDMEDELKILNLHSDKGKLKDAGDETVSLISPEELNDFRSLVDNVTVSGDIKKYIAGIATESRNHRSIYLGISPRASVYLMQAGKAWAAMKGRSFVTPDDIREMAFPVMAHRIILTQEREMEGTLPEDILQELLDNTEVPR